MKRLLNTAYPVRFWLTSILWASFFLTFLFITELGDDLELWQVFRAWVFIIFFAAVFSVPSFILVHFVFYGLASKKLPAFKRKTILVIVASAGMILTCLLIGIVLSEFSVDLFIPGSYLAGFLLASFLSDIEKPNNFPET